MTTTREQIDSIAPGQQIRCTVAKAPRAAGPRKTIERLMRLDPDNKRSLARAQHLRDRRMHRYIRGNRLWTSREKAARVVRVSDGAAWTMQLSPQIAGDLKSVATYLSVEKA
jgi:ribosomal protein S21